MINKVMPDIIHTQGIRADLCSIALSRGYNSVCTLRTYPFYDYPAKFGKFYGTIMACKHIQALKTLNVIVCSKTTQNQLSRYGIKSLAIQNGVDVAEYSPVSPIQKNSLRKKLGLEENVFMYVTVGSLISRKDMQTIINAFYSARHKIKSRLIVLGAGYQWEYLQSLKKDNSVIFAGNVTNVAEYLQAGNVFVSSSLAEGLPNTVLEAMACGLPCLLSDIPSHREITGEKMEWGFPCKDVEKLVRLMESIEVSDAVQMGNYARQNVEKNFSAKNMSELYQEKYRSI
jgi:glycosyltransferase involved in cell wall biosynthesis